MLNKGLNLHSLAWNKDLNTVDPLFKGPTQHNLPFSSSVRSSFTHPLKWQMDLRHASSTEVANASFWKCLHEMNCCQKLSLTFLHVAP